MQHGPVDQPSTRKIHQTMENNARVVIATGASRGTGHAIALEFARHGYACVLAACGSIALSRTATERGIGVAETETEMLKLQGLSLYGQPG